MTQVGSTSLRFKIGDAASYDPVAEPFDRFSSRVSIPLAERLISLAGLSPGEQILDVGTGTGILALLAAPRLGPRGRVVGIDLSEGMLALAAAKAARAGLDRWAEFLRRDAESLELPDRSFDAVVSLYALLHFPDPLRALKEMHRMLRPGGRLVVAVGSGPAPLSLAGLCRAAGRLPEALRELRGRRLTAPGFLNRLVARHLPGPAESEETAWSCNNPNRTRVVPRLVREAGFTDLRTCWQRHEEILEGPEEFWEVQLTFSSLARKRVAAAPAEKVADLRREFLETCRRVQSRGGQLAYPSAAFYVVARRSAD